MGHDNPWIVPDRLPPQPTRAGARRVASRAATTGSLHARNYDRMAKRFLAFFQARAPRTFQGMWDAMGAARHELVADGTLSEGQAQRLQEWLVRDLEDLAAARVRGSRAAVEEARSCAALDVGALAALLAVLDDSGDVAQRAASHARGLRLRRVGEVTCAGALTCTQCGRAQRLAASTRLEPCRLCHGGTYTRAT